MVKILQARETKVRFLNSMRSFVCSTPSKDHTLIELTGGDRSGLVSELSAVLADMGCNVVNAEIWTHNARAAAVIHVVDHSTQLAIQGPKRVLMINELLFNVMRGDGGVRTPSARMSVSVLDCSDRDYTVVTIRHVDGFPISSEAEEQRVMECLEAAIERRTTENDWCFVILQGLELEVITDDQSGLLVLSDITRIIRENGLCIKRAEISTSNEAARFHLCRCIGFFAKESRKA
ncbi:hypothetical protein V6N13_123439 [Hibiscus sabdariffa]